MQAGLGCKLEVFAVLQHMWEGSNIILCKCTHARVHSGCSLMFMVLVPSPDSWQTTVVGSLCVVRLLCHGYPGAVVCA